jgi:hypothetical protein
MIRPQYPIRRTERSANAERPSRIYARPPAPVNFRMAGHSQTVSGWTWESARLRVAAASMFLRQAASVQWPQDDRWSFSTRPEVSVVSLREARS